MPRRQAQGLGGQAIGVVQALCLVLVLGALATHGAFERLEFPVVEEGEEAGLNGFMFAGGLQRELVFNNAADEQPLGDQQVGLKFRLDDRIPPGTTLLKAFIFFTAAVTSTDETPALRVFGIKADNGPDLTSGESTPFLLRDSERVLASSFWEPGSWIAGNDFRTNTVHILLQEILDRPGYQPGNNIVFRIQRDKGDASIRSRIAVAGSARLVVDIETIETPSPTLNPTSVPPTNAPQSFAPTSTPVDTPISTPTSTPTSKPTSTPTSTPIRTPTASPNLQGAGPNIAPRPDDNDGGEDDNAGTSLFVILGGAGALVLVVIGISIVNVRKSTRSNNSNGRNGGASSTPPHYGQPHVFFPVERPRTDLWSGHASAPYNNHMISPSPGRMTHPLPTNQNYGRAVPTLNTIHSTGGRGNNQTNRTMRAGSNNQMGRMGRPAQNTFAYEPGLAKMKVDRSRTPTVWKQYVY